MAKNAYEILRNKQQEEFNKFPMGFAFSDEQFKEAMEKLGLTEKDTDKVVSIGAGGFIRKSDVKSFNEMNNRLDKEKKEAIAADKDGTGFIKDMFLYELGNHEYIITYDLTDTLDSLDLTMEDVEKDPRLQKGLQMARKEYLDGYNKPKNKTDYER